MTVVPCSGAFILWNIDRSFCPTVRHLYLHAFWHLGAGAGTFTVIILWIWIRGKVLGQKPEVAGSYPLNYVEVQLDKVV